MLSNLKKGWFGKSKSGFTLFLVLEILWCEGVAKFGESPNILLKTPNGKKSNFGRIGIGVEIFESLETA